MFALRHGAASDWEKTAEASVGRSWFLVVSADMPDWRSSERTGKHSLLLRMGLDATSVPASLLERTIDCALAVEVNIALSRLLSTKDGIVVVVPNTHQ